MSTFNIVENLRQQFMRGEISADYFCNEKNRLLKELINKNKENEANKTKI